MIMWCVRVCVCCVCVAHVCVCEYVLLGMGHSLVHIVPSFPRL